MDGEIAALMILGITAVVLFWFLRRREPPLPPGPSGIPVVGFLPWIDAKAPHLTLTRLAKLYGPIYSLRMGSVFTVVLSDQRLIRQAFARDIFSGRAPLYLTHGIMKGYGLICAQGELWKDQRKFVSTFLKNFGMVKFGPKRDKMEQIISVRVEECLKKLEKLATTGEALDVLPLLLHCVGNVMNAIVFGVVYEEEDFTWKWLQHLQEEGTKYIGVAGPINFLPYLRYIPRFKNIMDSLIDGKEKTHTIYQTIIDKHIQKRETVQRENGVIVDDLIYEFLEEKERRGEGNDDFYCKSQFYHLLADMFGAGLDTTVTTIRWFILFMAEYSEIQSKVQEEIDGLIGNRTPTLEDIPMLPYTEAALAETQRIRSVVPVGIPHGSLEESTLAGYRIPKGTMIVPLQWSIHMDCEHWSEPEIFKPERFLSQDGRFTKPEAFIPFQTGKRMCVGEELGHMLLFLFGAAIIHHFTISPPDGAEIDLEGECGITLTPKPQKLVFTPRY